MFASCPSLAGPRMLRHCHRPKLQAEFRAGLSQRRARAICIGTNCSLALAVARARGAGRSTITASGRRLSSTSDAQPTKKKEKAKDGETHSWGARLLYEYYNRRSTASDLQLFMLFFVALSLFNGILRSLLVDGGTPSSFVAFWRDLYEVLVLSFGQEFPEVGSPDLVHQAFSVVVAGIGLASFALVLALVEQAVLEVVEANVRRGSRVFESRHVLVLGWCSSQRDLEVVWKTLEQLCYAYRNEGGCTVVILVQRPKLEMEALFKRVIPESKRFGCRFVFREGSPLVPSDLELVAAKDAHTTIIVSDQSRCPEEADAQSVRCAILLDEMCDNPREAGPIVVQMTTSNAIPLLRYACSSRAVPVPTARLNARRVAKMVKQPFIAAVSKEMMDFKKRSNMYVQHVPELVGARFEECAFRFLDTIVMGVVNADGTCRLNPARDYLVLPDDDLILLRPTSVCEAQYTPLPQKVDVEEQFSWLERSQHFLDTLEPACDVSSMLGTSSGREERPPQMPAAANGSTPAAGQWVASAQVREAVPSSSTSSAPQQVPPGLNGRGLRSGSYDDSISREWAAAGGPSNSPGPNGTSGSHQSLGASPRDPAQQPATSSRDSSTCSVTWQSLLASQGIALSAGSGHKAPSPDRGPAFITNMDPSVATSGSSSSASESGGSFDGVTEIVEGFGAADGQGGSSQPAAAASSATGVGVSLLPQDSVSSIDSFDTLLPGQVPQKLIASPSPPPPATALPALPTAVPAPLPATQQNGAKVNDGAVGSRSFSPPTSPSASASGTAASSSSRKSGFVRSLLQPQAVGPHSSADLLKKDMDLVFMVPIEYLVDDNKPERVLVAGWAEQSFMRNVLRELDHGQLALPPGSEVVFVNTHDRSQVDYAIKIVHPKNISVSHIQAAPLQRVELAAVGLEGFKCAIVLCDEKWVDPDQDSANGIDELQQRDMLRLDSMVMMVQLNIRKILDDSDRPTINIICQKVASEGMTRFEDRNRLPLGISVNFTSYAAKLLTQVVYNPRSLIAYSHFGEAADMVTINACELAGEGEAVSFVVLQRRAQLRDMVLIGWYLLPRKVEGALKLVVNPVGEEARSKPRIWNTGDTSGKFIVMRTLKCKAPTLNRSYTSALSTSSMDDAYMVEQHKQARWVVLAAQQAELRARAEAQPPPPPPGVSTITEGDSQAPQPAAATSSRGGGSSGEWEATARARPSGASRAVTMTTNPPAATLDWGDEEGPQLQQQPDEPLDIRVTAAKNSSATAAPTAGSHANRASTSTRREPASSQPAAAVWGPGGDRVVAPGGGGLRPGFVDTGPSHPSQGRRTGAWQATVDIEDLDLGDIFSDAEGPSPLVPGGEGKATQPGVTSQQQQQQQQQQRVTSMSGTRGTSTGTGTGVGSQVQPRVTPGSNGASKATAMGTPRVTSQAGTVAPLSPDQSPLSSPITAQEQQPQQQQEADVSNTRERASPHLPIPTETAPSQLARSGSMKREMSLGDGSISTPSRRMQLMSAAVARAGGDASSWQSQVSTEDEEWGIDDMSTG